MIPPTKLITLVSPSRGHMDAERGEHRRVFIKTVGVGVTGMLAGCLGDDTDTGGDDGDSTDGGADEDKPSNAEDNGTDPDGNGEGDGVPENGGENGTGNETNPGGNGQENGGEGDQPDELLEAARILDGEDQELDSITLGEENDAVTSQNLTLETEGTGEAEYTAQIEYNGEEPGFAEELEQMLENTGEINIGEQINIGQLQYEQIKNQIQENTDANININIQQGETTEELSLDLEILADLLDAEKMKQTNDQNIQQAMKKVPHSPEGYSTLKFFDIENLRRVAEHYGIEYQEEDGLIDVVIQPLTEDTEDLDYTNMISDFGFRTEGDVVYDDYARIWFFDKDIGKFTGNFNGDKSSSTLKSFSDEGNYISRTVGSFPDSLESFYADENHPSILEGGDYPLFEFEEFEDDIVLKFIVGAQFNTGSVFERVPMGNDPYNNVNVVKYNPEDDNFTEEIWFYRENQGGYEVLSTRVRDDVENLLHPITEVEM